MWWGEDLSPFSVAGAQRLCPAPSLSPPHAVSSGGETALSDRAGASDIPPRRKVQEASGLPGGRALRPGLPRRKNPAASLRPTGACVLECSRGPARAVPVDPCAQAPAWGRTARPPTSNPPLPNPEPLAAALPAALPGGFARGGRGAAEGAVGSAMARPAGAQSQGDTQVRGSGSSSAMAAMAAPALPTPSRDLCPHSSPFSALLPSADIHTCTQTGCPRPEIAHMLAHVCARCRVVDDPHAHPHSHICPPGSCTHAHTVWAHSDTRRVVHDPDAHPRSNVHTRHVHSPAHSPALSQNSGADTSTQEGRALGARGGPQGSPGPVPSPPTLAPALGTSFPGA